MHFYVNRMLNNNTSVSQIVYYIFGKRKKHNKKCTGKGTLEPCTKLFFSRSRHIYKVCPTYFSKVALPSFLSPYPDFFSSFFLIIFELETWEMCNVLWIRKCKYQSILTKYGYPLSKDRIHDAIHEAKVHSTGAWQPEGRMGCPPDF